MKSCKQVADTIGPYLYGQATQQETDALEEHLSSCPGCASDVAQRRRTIALLTAVEPTEGEYDRIVRGVRTRIAADSVRVHGSRTGRLLRLAGAVAAAILLFVAGMSVGQHRAAEQFAQRIAFLGPPIAVEPVHPATAGHPSERRRKANVGVPRLVRRHAPTVLAADAATREFKHRVHHQVTAVARKAQRHRPSVHREDYVAVAQAVHTGMAPVPLGVDDARLVAVEE